MPSYPQADTPVLSPRSQIVHRAQMPRSATWSDRRGMGQTSSLAPATRATAAPICQTPTHNQEGR